MMLSTLLALLIAALVALPFLAEALRSPVSRHKQEASSGQIAALSQGRTHYRWHGPETGKIALCIHGLSTPSYVFAATERSLASLGYRVLSYDLYGRGLSDRVSGRQNALFFQTQVNDLLANQKVDGEITVLGFSMGAQIATKFAADNGSRVDALILAAPAGIASKTSEQNNPLWLMPIVGDWLARVLGGRAMRRELVEHRTTPTIIPDLEDRQAVETKTRGFLPAVLSSRRHLLSKSLLADLNMVSRLNIPILAIWGAEDPIVPLSASGLMARQVPDAHHAQIAGAGHNLLQTHPAQVASELTKFLAP
jgi:pimeloyl-ACP methyl ester carboxylesterase